MSMLNQCDIDWLVKVLDLGSKVYQNFITTGIDHAGRQYCIEHKCHRLELTSQVHENGCYGWRLTDAGKCVAELGRRLRVLSEPR